MDRFSEDSPFYSNNAGRLDPHIFLRIQGTKDSRREVTSGCSEAMIFHKYDAVAWRGFLWRRSILLLREFGSQTCPKFPCC
jgi:hypothetical protein